MPVDVIAWRRFDLILLIETSVCFCRWRATVRDLDELALLEWFSSVGHPLGNGRSARSGSDGRVWRAAAPPAGLGPVPSGGSTPRRRRRAIALPRRGQSGPRDPLDEERWTTVDEAAGSSITAAVLFNREVKRLLIAPDAQFGDHHHAREQRRSLTEAPNAVDSNAGVQNGPATDDVTVRHRWPAIATVRSSPSRNRSAGSA